jgi:nucleotide-binding universal stress UspA family protein
LTVAHVVDTDTLYEEAPNYAGDTGTILKEWLTEAGAIVDAATVSAGSCGVQSLETSVVTGNPVDELLSLALARDADLIVVGTHGRRGLRRMLLGSFAETLVRRSPIPVAVVRGSPGERGAERDAELTAAGKRA